MKRKILKTSVVASLLAGQVWADTTAISVIEEGLWDDLLDSYSSQSVTRTTSSTTTFLIRTSSSKRTSLPSSATSSTVSSSIKAPQASATSLNSLFDTVLDAFTCGGQQNLSGTFAGLSNLIGAVGGDPYFLNAAEAALYGNFTLFQTPAFFMGIGVGEGTIIGLNATTESEAEEYAAAAMAAASVDDGSQSNGASEPGATSFNNIAKEFGLGIVNISLPAILASDSEDFFAGLNISDFARGGGVGFADGLGTALKPVLGENFGVFGIQIDDRAAKFENDSRGAGALAYSFARGLASQVGNLGLAFIGVQTDGTRDMLQAEIDAENGGRRWLDATVKSRGTALNPRKAIDATLVNSAKSDQIISEFAQLAVSELSCSALGGIWALALDFLSGSDDSAVPRIPSFSGYNLPDIDVVVQSHENRYQVNFKSLSVQINGRPLISFIGLLVSHIVVAMFAFAGLFPTVLIVSAVERLATSTGLSSDSAVLSRGVKIIQIAVIPIFIIVGLALGVASTGNSRHFRTPHAIIGLVLSILSLASSAMTLFRRIPKCGEEPGLTQRAKGFSLSTPSDTSPVPVRPSQHRLHAMNHPAKYNPTMLEVAFIISILGLTFATWITGIEDLRFISLCVVEVISATLIAAIAAIINGLLNAAAAIVLLEWWILQRIQNATSKCQDMEHHNKVARHQSPVRNGHLIDRKEIKHLVPLPDEPEKHYERQDHVYNHQSHHRDNSIGSSIGGTRSARMVKGAKVVDVGEKRREDVGVAF